jgi:hypothetical protein
MCRPRIKYKLALGLLASLTVLCGCAHQYLMKLSNGDQVVSLSKPKLREHNYYFTDSEGVAAAVPQSRVVKIETISVVKQDQKPPAPAKPKGRKHWYFLWLA